MTHVSRFPGNRPGEADESAPRRQKHNRTSFFSMKLLAEKAITSSDYKMYILLLDMSKAFDTVNRNQLFETLEDLLLPDEIHLLHILTNDVKLKVRVGAEHGPEFTTSVGITHRPVASNV